MGINRFIKNAKECLYRNKKINKRSQSRAYGLNSFKFNNIFQTQQKPTRFATTKKINYYDDNNNIFNKRNFGYYRPRNLNLSYLSSTNNNKDKIKNRRQKLNYYTTYNAKNIESSMGSINENYNLIPINKNKKYFSSEQNSVYHPEKCSSVPKKVKININRYNKNYNKNHGLNMNLLNRIRERINNDGRVNKYKEKNKDKKYYIDKWRKYLTNESTSKVKMNDPFIILANIWAHKPVIKDLENVRINPNLIRKERVKSLSNIIIRNDLEFYIPQLCSFIIFGDNELVDQLLSFLCKSCYCSFFFAHRVIWFLKSMLTNEEIHNTSDNEMNNRISDIIHTIQTIFKSDTEKEKKELKKYFIAGDFR